MALDGKLVIVTGAAGGIGRAVCELFAAEGAILIATDIDEDGLMKTLEAVKGSPNERKHLAVKCDVARSNSVDELAEQILQQYGEPPTVVVHSAGIQPGYGGILACSEEQFDFTVAAVLKGTFLVTKKFISFMREFEVQGSIINFSSTAAAGSTYAPDYSAAKAGVEGFTKAVAKELGPYGIRVNAIAPGPIDTAFVRTLGEASVEKLVESTPVGRLGRPDEVARICLLLADDKCTFCTGSVYPITGGFTR